MDSSNQDVRGIEEDPKDLFKSAGDDSDGDSDQPSSDSGLDAVSNPKALKELFRNEV